MNGWTLWITNSQPRLDKTTPGEVVPLPASSWLIFRFAPAPHANPITVEAVSVNVTSSAVAPASVALAGILASAAAEVETASVHATD